MKKLLGKFKDRNGSADELSLPPPGDDSPEANVTRAVVRAASWWTGGVALGVGADEAQQKRFCESGGNPSEGDEVAQLPTIVEGAESSPAAAKLASSLLRRYLTKEYSGKAHMQYNAVMLLRILSTNPGPSFTRNIDSKFVATVKDCVRFCKDPSVLQILRETLDSFERNEDEGLSSLKEMWRKERASSMPNYNAQTQRMSNFNVPTGGQPLPSRGTSTSTTLPNPEELAGRIEEAKTSAKLLLQVVQSTPPAELMNNELIQEFATRCSQASRSMQKFIHCQNPSPDEDTLLTLIETNDQLSMAMSQHQRAVLQARKEMSRQNSSSEVPQRNVSPPQPAAAQPFSEPVLPPIQRSEPIAHGAVSPPQAAAAAPAPAPVEEDPFADRHAEGRHQEHSDLYGGSTFSNLAISDTPNLNSNTTTRERGYSDAYAPPTPPGQRRAAPQPPVSPLENGLQQHPVSSSQQGYSAGAGGLDQHGVSPPSSPQMQTRKATNNSQFRY